MDREVDGCDAESWNVQTLETNSSPRPKIVSKDRQGEAHRYVSSIAVSATFGGPLIQSTIAAPGSANSPEFRGPPWLAPRAASAMSVVFRDQCNRPNTALPIAFFAKRNQKQGRDSSIRKSFMASRRDRGIPNQCSRKT